MDLLIVGHLLGDFYLQTETLAEKKKISPRYMLLHCLLYAAAVYFALFWQRQDYAGSVLPAILLMALHGAVDGFKVWIEKRGCPPKRAVVIFLLDQCAHIAALWFVSICWNVDSAAGSCFMNVSAADIHKAALAAIGVLICWKPAAIFMALTLQMISDAENEDDSEKQEEANEVRGIGQWIGVLEREMILLLGLMGQYGAIGYVLTAKSISRYKQLENKAFAEKYLIGTLLSALIAMTCAAAYRVMMQ